MSEVEIKKSGAQVLYECLRARTEQSKVTGKKFLTMNTPEGLEKEELSALLPLIGTAECPEELKDITCFKGRKDTYYYDPRIMTWQYAELDAMISEKDLLHTIATVTRSDCQLYPRPTRFSKLKDMPFWMTEDELLGAAARMKFEPEYADIGVVTASNGAKGFYSTKFMSEVYAQALIEVIEVEEDLYP